MAVIDARLPGDFAPAPTSRSLSAGRNHFPTSRRPTPRVRAPAHRLARRSGFRETKQFDGGDNYVRAFDRPPIRADHAGRREPVRQTINPGRANARRHRAAPRVLCTLVDRVLRKNCTFRGKISVVIRGFRDFG